MKALDLSIDVPRSPFAEQGGLPWLPRLIDKVRAMQAGTLGDYVPYPCPADQRFLDLVGLQADPLAEAIRQATDDGAVLAFIREQGTARTPDEVAAFRRNMLAPATDPERLERLAKARRELKAARPEADVEVIDNSIKLICVDEGHPIPQA